MNSKPSKALSDLMILLCKRRESKIISLLLTTGDIRLKVGKNKRWSNVELAEGALLTPKQEPKVSEEEAQAFRKLWPTPRRAALAIVHERLEAFLYEHPSYTMKDVMRAARTYLNETDPQFVAKTHYFVKKNVHHEGVQSKLLDYLEQFEDEAQTNTYNDEAV